MIKLGKTHDFNEMVKRRIWLINTTISIIAFFIYVMYFMLAWKWFVVPLGLPNIGFVHALGIKGMIAIIMPFANEKNVKDESGRIIGLLIAKTITFVLLFIVQLFM